MKVISLITILLFPVSYSFANPNNTNPFDSITKSNENEPTFINSDSLTVNNQTREFQYTGNVKVIKGDMTLTAETLNGDYDENNKIKNLTAKKNVVIVKGPSIRATGERATYDAKTEVVTLHDNPEVTQNGSTLSADVVKIFLKENRSKAEGQVRMKMIERKEDSNKNAQTSN